MLAEIKKVGDTRQFMGKNGVAYCTIVTFDVNDKEYHINVYKNPEYMAKDGYVEGAVGKLELKIETEIKTGKTGTEYVETRLYVKSWDAVSVPSAEEQAAKAEMRRKEKELAERKKAEESAAVMAAAAATEQKAADAVRQAQEDGYSTDMPF